jgi:hypothetical protein
MGPVSVFANGPAGEIEQLEAGLRGRWRQATRAVMVLLSAHGLPPAQIAALLGCHPAAGSAGSTARGWRGWRTGRGPGGQRWAGSGRPGGSLRCWPGRARGSLPRIRQYLGWPQVSPRTLYRRVRLVAIWPRPRLTARGDPDHDQVVAAIVARLIDLPRRAVVLAEDETHLNLLPHVRASRRCAACARRSSPRV